MGDDAADHGVVVEVEPAGCRHDRHPEGRHVAGGGVEVHVGAHPPGACFTIDQRAEERHHPGADPPFLGREHREQALRFRGEQALEHGVTADPVVGVDQGHLEHGGQVGGVGHRVGETGEEALELAPDHVGEELVAPSGEEAVAGGPRHAGFPGDVLDRGLGQPEARHGREGGLQDPVAGVLHLRHYRPRSASSPIVRPGLSGTARTAISTPGMNDERS